MALGCASQLNWCDAVGNMLMYGNRIPLSLPPPPPCRTFSTIRGQSWTSVKQCPSTFHRSFVRSSSLPSDIAQWCSMLVGSWCCPSLHYSTAPLRPQSVRMSTDMSFIHTSYKHHSILLLLPPPLPFLTLFLLIVADSARTICECALIVQILEIYCLECQFYRFVSGGLIRHIGMCRWLPTVGVVFGRMGGGSFRLLTHPTTEVSSFFALFSLDEMNFIMQNFNELNWEDPFLGCGERKERGEEVLPHSSNLTVLIFPYQLICYECFSLSFCHFI